MHATDYAQKTQELVICETIEGEEVDETVIGIQRARIGRLRVHQAYFEQEHV